VERPDAPHREGTCFCDSAACLTYTARLAAMSACGPFESRAIAYERELGGMVSLRPILRDARFQRASQDEVLFRGEILDPHGEERRLRRVSNHEAKYAIGPYAIALPLRGTDGC
jgi:hypothetical protein